VSAANILANIVAKLCKRLAAAHSPHVLNVPELVRDELAAHAVAPTPDGQVILQGPSMLMVDARAGQSIALVLHELATETASLEAAFITATGMSEEYVARRTPTPGGAA